MRHWASKCGDAPKLFEGCILPDWLWLPESVRRPVQGWVQCHSFATLSGLEKESGAVSISLIYRFPCKPVPSRVSQLIGENFMSRGLTWGQGWGWSKGSLRGLVTWWATCLHGRHIYPEGEGAYQRRLFTFTLQRNTGLSPSCITPEAAACLNRAWSQRSLGFCPASRKGEKKCACVLGEAQ